MLRRGNSLIINKKHISWDYNHLFSIPELDAELPRQRMKWLPDGGKGNVLREGAKDILCLHSLSCQEPGWLADRAEQKHEWSQYKFHKKIAFSTMHSNNMFICLSPLDCKPLQEKNQWVKFLWISSNCIE